MKSRVLELYDYKDIELEKEDTVEGVKAQVESLVFSITRHYKTKVPAESVEPGDIAAFKSVSDEPKFNKSMLPINVGKGLFDKAFEDAVIGMKNGETGEITFGDKKAVVTVLSISRTVYPELTDEMVREQITDDNEDFGGIKTAEEFIKTAEEQTFHSLKEQMIYNGINNILGQVFAKSKWAFDEDELKAYAKHVYKTETDYLRSNGIKVEELKTEDDFLRAFGDIHSMEEVLQLVDDIARDTIAMALMACGWLGIDPETIDLYDEENIPDITNLIYDYITDNITFVKEA
ncbi:MAG: hypothetical protein Q4F21_10190 [Lachnospiraceae bacterium]|nr:hypothetical protein [Lachnospiraceae bacterium]